MSCYSIMSEFNVAMPASWPRPIATCIQILDFISAQFFPFSLLIRTASQNRTSFTAHEHLSVLTEGHIVGKSVHRTAGDVSLRYSYLGRRRLEPCCVLISTSYISSIWTPSPPSGLPHLYYRSSTSPKASCAVLMRYINHLQDAERPALISRLSHPA